MTASVESMRGLVRFGTFKEVLSVHGRYLNDHCFIHDGRLWHFFGIVGPVGKNCADEGSEVSFAHATSVDMNSWDIHDDVLKVCGEWPETSHVYAPNIIRHGKTYFMLYTALDEDRTQRLCLATSTDLFAWRRYPGNPAIVPSLHWAKWAGFGREKGGACRDPHILPLDDGRFVAYWVAELQHQYGRDLTCVAASLSYDLLHWQEAGPVFIIRAWDEPPTRAVESPCVVRKDGRYWLFFKHGWWTHFVVSEDPLDFNGCEPVRLGYCHASEIFQCHGKWLISHCSGDPEDYMYRASNRMKGLYLGNLDWAEGAYPKLV